MSGRALVVTVSTRASAGHYTDRSGPILVEGLAALGLSVDGPDVVADGDPLQARLRAALTQGYGVVVTTGGTGLAPDDRTPEITAALVDRPVPGLAEALRARGVAGGVPTAVLSRGVAGMAGTCLLVNVAGSTGAVRDALEVLAPVLVHALAQVGAAPGTGHAAGDAGSPR
jgi:molybdenum cofactor synthesis domain-containing protein